MAEQEKFCKSFMKFANPKSKSALIPQATGKEAERVKKTKERKVEKMDDLDFSLDLDLSLDLNNFSEKGSKKLEKDKEEKEADPNGFKKAVCIREGKRQLTRKASSEKQLEQILPWHFEDGDCYHCLSFGDVDSFSYARHIIKSHPIEYMLLSTWCMAKEDIYEMEDMLKRGIIKHIDFYVGEIFERTYINVNLYLLEMAKKYGCRVCPFKNHSKVYVLAGAGKYFTIESSANVNTNPRCENTVITEGEDLARYYKSFFEEITSFNKNNDTYWKKWEI